MYSQAFGCGTCETAFRDETPCTSKRFRKTPGSCIVCIVCVSCIICLGKAIPTVHVLRGQHGKRVTRKSHKKSCLGLGSNQCPVTFHILGPSQNLATGCYIGDAQPIVLVTKATKCGVRMITNRLTVSPGLRHRHLGAPTAAVVDFRRARHRGILVISWSTERGKNAGKLNGSAVDERGAAPGRFKDCLLFNGGWIRFHSSDCSGYSDKEVQAVRYP